jgi:hypothetical protein
VNLDQVEDGARGELGSGPFAEQLEEEELIEQLGGIVLVA